MGALSIRYLSQEDVMKCNVLDMEQAIRDVEEMFKMMASGDCIYRSKLVFWLKGDDPELADKRFTAQSAFLGGSFGTAGLKWVGSVPDNPMRRDLPRTSALIVISDPETGLPLGIMEGSVVSAVRTGASTGVAAKFLARAESQTVGLIGAGVQNRTQLLALDCALPKLEQVFVYDRASERTKRFISDMEQLTRLSLRACDDVEDMLKRVDVVVSATTSTKPIILGEWLRSGMFYAHVGDYECDHATLQRADKIVVDHLEGIRHWGKQTLALMLEEGTISESAVHAEIMDIVAGTKPGRSSEDEITYYCTIGLGSQDVAVGTRILRTAEREGIGMELKLWDNPFAV